jgi:hypothetical protein
MNIKFGVYNHMYQFSAKYLLCLLKITNMAVGRTCEIIFSKDECPILR